MALDLDDAEGQALPRLPRTSDIVVHSLKPGSTEQRGLGYEDLQPHCLGLIYCALSAFGNIEPLSAPTRLRPADPGLRRHHVRQRP